MTTARDWIDGARPRTLWTSVSPVAVGSAAAGALGGFRPLPAFLALVVGLALQIASNYANDYADGVRGTDVNRIGPSRLVASGRARPSAVSYTHLRAHETDSYLVCRLLLAKKK